MDDTATDRLLRKLLAQLKADDARETAAAEVGLPVEHAGRLQGANHQDLVADARNLATQLNLPQTEQRFTEAEVLEATKAAKEADNETLHWALGINTHQGDNDA